MQFSAIIATALLAASSTMATPAVRRNSPPPNPLLCAGIEGSPQCCATDVLGLADLNCNPPPSVPQDRQDFVDICAAIGQQAECCTLPVLGQALVCQVPPA